MKVDVYKCDRCGARLEIQAERKPITVTHLDGRFMNEETETLHLCDDCYVTFLYAVGGDKTRQEAFNELADKFDSEDEKEMED